MSLTCPDCENAPMVCTCSNTANTISAKTSPNYHYVVLYDEIAETCSGLIGCFLKYSSAVQAIKNIHPKVICIDETSFIGIDETEHLFEYNTHLYSIHQQIIK